MNTHLTGLFCVLCCVLYSVFCVLYFVFCILCSVFYIEFCILYSVFCVLCSVFCILYSVYGILYSVFCCILLNSVFCCIVYPVLCILYSDFRGIEWSEWTPPILQCTLLLRLKTEEWSCRAKHTQQVFNPLIKTTLAVCQWIYGNHKHTGCPTKHDNWWIV